MRVLVTGGAGFLGSHLCAKLLSQGQEILCVDNLLTGSINNIKDFLSNPNFQFIEQDVTEPFDFVVDQIFNFACPASPIHYQFDPIQTLKTSVFGVLNCLDLAKKNGARFLQASTSEVYGDPQISPQPESYWGNVNPVGIRACYDEGKRCAETLIFDFKRKYNVDVRVARIFNTYGPKMDSRDGRVVSNFIVQALKKKPLTIYGDGNQTRSFCYVDDLIDGICRLMNQDATAGPVNLGNPKEFTILELAQKVLKLTGSNMEMVFKHLPQDDPRQRCPDITIAKTDLGWEPLIQLQEGLQKTISYFSSL